MNSRDDRSNQCFHYLFWRGKKRNSTVNCNAIVSKNRKEANHCIDSKHHKHTMYKMCCGSLVKVTHVPSSSSKHTNVWGRLSSGSVTTKSKGRDNWRHKVRFQSTLWYRLAVRALLMVLYEVLREICRKVVFKRNVRMIEIKLFLFCCCCYWGLGGLVLIRVVERELKG